MALPLGIATTMAALNLNMPRYFIHARLGERELGIYSAMAYATVPMILVSDSLGHSVVPRLARFYAGARLAEYRSLLLKMLAVGACLGLAGLTGAQLLGARLLSLFFGSEYAAHSRTFVVLILAAAIYCVACMFTSAITSARRFMIQPPIYVLVAAQTQRPVRSGCRPRGWRAAPRPWLWRRLCIFCLAPGWWVTCFMRRRDRRAASRICRRARAVGSEAYDSSDV